MKSIILSFTVGLMASAAFLLSSCQDEELTITRSGNGGIQEGINYAGDYNNALTIIFTFDGDKVSTIKNNGLKFDQGYDLISTIEIKCE